MSEDRTGRLDLLVTDGLGRLCDRAGSGVREAMQPLIDRFVSEQVTSNKIPVTPIAIAEELGILRKNPKPRVKRPAQGNHDE